MDGIKLAIKTKLIQSEFESFSEAVSGFAYLLRTLSDWVCNLCRTMTIVTESDNQAQILPSPAFHPSSLNPSGQNIEQKHTDKQKRSKPYFQLIFIHKL